MQTKPCVGILLPKEILPRIVRQKPTWEAAERYVEAAAGLDLDVVLFSLGGYSPRERAVRGVMWREGGWRPWKGPLPPVVHNRVVPATLGLFYLVRLMAKQAEVGVFNPAVTRDRWVVWAALLGGKASGEHLPYTRPLDRALCHELPSLVSERGRMAVRPGYLGTGPDPLFVEPVSGSSRRYRVTPVGGRSRTLGRDDLVLLMLRRRARWPHIVQDCVELIEHEGVPRTLWVSVQKDGQGAWRVVGATARAVAAEGARPYYPVLKEVFGAFRTAEIGSEVSRLSLGTAELLSKSFPDIADLALDFGLDSAGRPWLIDVDFRDRRTGPKLAGLDDLHAELYRNPIEYAAHLIRRSAKESTRGRFALFGRPQAEAVTGEGRPEIG